MTTLGQNNSGDFDQLSLHGVDFGEDYTKSYDVKPTNLKGDKAMYGYSQQLGDAHQMGVIPQGLGAWNSSADFGSHNQMGHSKYNQMGALFVVPAGIPVVGGMAVTPIHAAVGGLAIAVIGQKMGFWKLPFSIPGLT